tara:strand:+ start:3684 stop:4304 length:621 start_codon:yes stop_codon:yes gene_type:complete
MHFFIDKNQVIVQREHKFNAEYLDGKLTPVKNNAVCYLVKHTPNDTSSYDLQRLAVISALVGFPKISNLNAQYEATNPPTYHNLIPVDSFWTYVSKTNYTDATDNTEILASDPDPIRVTMVSEPATTVQATVTETPAITVPQPNVVSTTTQATATASASTTPGPFSKVGPGEMADALQDSDFPLPTQLSATEDAIYKFVPPGIKNT